MGKYVAITTLLLAAGCEACPPSFNPGEFVEHKLTGERGVVIGDPARSSNYQGFCLVPVRFNDVGSYSIYELREATDAS